MTISQMLSQSGILTLLGMAVVFSFLIIMILSMKLLHGVLHALHLDKDEPQKSPQGTASVPSAPATAPTQSVDTGAVVAAIAAALHEKQ